VRVVHEAAEGGKVPLAQCPDRLEDTVVLTDDVTGALQLVAREASEVFFVRVPQLPYA
jgi:hypothetical protein